MPAAQKSSIHPTAVIDPRANVHATAEVGPYCVIGPDVSIGAGTKLFAHVVIDGRVAIGARNLIYPGACIGFPAQARPSAVATLVRIGDDNIFREHVTIHAGSKEAGTVVGSRCFFMAGSHVGHDCAVADDVTMANSAALGGHVVVEEKVMIGGLCGIHQNIRIGKYSMIGGLTKPAQDVLPFTLVEGRPARLAGVNLVGLRRAKFSPQAIRDIRRAVRLIHYSGGKFKDVLAAVRAEFAGSPEVQHLVRFIESSKRGVVRRGADHSPAAES